MATEKQEAGGESSIRQQSNKLKKFLSTQQPPRETHRKVAMKHMSGESHGQCLPESVLSEATASLKPKGQLKL